MPRRHIPSKHTPYQPNFGCTGKKRYAKVTQAERAKEEAELLTPDLELAVYRCQYCSGWHLTSRKSSSSKS